MKKKPVSQSYLQILLPPLNNFSLNDIETCFLSNRNQISSMENIFNISTDKDLALLISLFTMIADDKQSAHRQIAFLLTDEKKDIPEYEVTREDKLLLITALIKDSRFYSHAMMLRQMYTNTISRMKQREIKALYEKYRKQIPLIKLDYELSGKRKTTFNIEKLYPYAKVCFPTAASGHNDFENFGTKYCISGIGDLYMQRDFSENNFQFKLKLKSCNNMQKGKIVILFVHNKKIYKACILIDNNDMEFQSNTFSNFQFNSENDGIKVIKIEIYK